MRKNYVWLNENSRIFSKSLERITPKTKVNTIPTSSSIKILSNYYKGIFQNDKQKQFTSKGIENSVEGEVNAKYFLYFESEYPACIKRANPWMAE